MKRVRGVLTIAALWGIAYAVWSALISLVMWTLSPEVRRYSRFTDLFDVVPRSGLEAMAAGAIFALIVMSAERRNTIGSISKRRFWWWGAIGGATAAASIRVLERMFGMDGAWSATEPLKDVVVYCITVGVVGGAAAEYMLRLARGERGRPTAFANRRSNQVGRHADSTDGL